jgi:DNA-binding NarL/FixJ family response regulator
MSRQPAGQSPHQPVPQPLPLSRREHEVLRELALGNSNKRIARALYISAYTVDGYVKDIYRKLGVHNRSMAAVIAVHHGLLNAPSLSPVNR